MFSKQSYFGDSAAGSANYPAGFYDNTYAQQESSKISKAPSKTRECATTYYDRLYEGTLVRGPGIKTPVEPGGRKNRNVLLSLTIARLLRNLYLSGITRMLNYELSCGIPINLSYNEFILILRTDGRIIAMSDAAEYHLGKSMRSLYTQFINIFECLDETDGGALKTILDSSMNLPNQEHRLVCTFRLPKGKRPSRINEDVKTICMTGHFSVCDDSPSTERLFIAHCEAILSPTTKGTNSSQSSSSSSSSTTTATTTILSHNDSLKSVLTITLREDMVISTISSNTKEILGHKNNEMVGQWLGRYIAAEDLAKLETIQQKFFQHEKQQQQAKAVPLSICEMFDLYGNYGDQRLTFLFQIRVRRQRKSKSIEFVIVAQMIDPSVRNNMGKYIESETKEISVLSTEGQQVNLVCSSTSSPQTGQDQIVAASPSIDDWLLMPNSNDGYNQSPQQQFSPFVRQLSNVGPIDFDDKFWEQFCNNNNSTPDKTAKSECWGSDFFDDFFSSYQSGLDWPIDFNGFDEL